MNYSREETIQGRNQKIEEMKTQLVHAIWNSSSERILQNCVTKLENYVNLLCYEGNWHKDAHRTSYAILA